MRTTIVGAWVAIVALVLPFASSATTTSNGIYFHVDDFFNLGGGSFGLLVPITGAHSLWCGTVSNQYVSPYGYGNGWDESWESCGFPVVPGATLTAEYDICYHTAADSTGLRADSLYFEIFDNSTWQVLRAYGGGPQCLHEIVPLPGNFSGTMRLRFRFSSDAVGSDEDGIDTDGAAVIDNIRVLQGTQTIDFQDFECEQVGAQQTIDGIWAAGPHPVCGDSTVCATFYNPGCDTACAPAAGLTNEQVSFEYPDFSAGDPISGLGTLNPHLNITPMASTSQSCSNLGNAAVVRTGSASPFWAYKSGTPVDYHGCLTGSQGMGDPDHCVMDYQFTFAPGRSAFCFGLRLLDFGDYFTNPSFLPHTVTLTAYDANNVPLDSDVLSFNSAGPIASGDACAALPGDPGNRLFRVQSTGIRRVVLAFTDEPDPRVGIDDLTFCVYQDSLPCTPPPPGLRGWWTGDLVPDDFSGYGNDGALVNNAAYAPFPRVRTGAFRFDGGSWVQVPDNPSLDFGVATQPGFGNFSFDAWVLLPDTTGPHPILSKFSSMGIGYEFFVVNGQLGATLQTTTGGITVLDPSTLRVGSNTWNFVAASVDRNPSGPSITFFMNGQTGGTALLNAAQVSTDISNSGDIQIGAETGLSKYLTGDLDEVELYARVVGGAEFQAIYNAGYAGKCVQNSFHDCNGNGTDDLIDIANGYSQDANGNDTPDECEDSTGCGDMKKCCLYFETQIAWASAPQTVTIVNTCGAPFSGTVADTCSDFQVTTGAGPYTIAPGDSHVVTVIFTPTAVGTTACTIPTGVFPGLLCTGVGTASTPAIVTVRSFDALWESGRVKLVWSLDAPGSATDFRMFRRENGSLTDVEIAHPRLPADGATFSMFDDAVGRGIAYVYRVEALVQGIPVASATARIRIPTLRFALDPLQPNPFTASTSIGFSVDRNTRTTLRVYDASGRVVRTLVDRRLIAGSYHEQWNGRDSRGRRVATGIYFVRLERGREILTRKAVVIR